MGESESGEIKTKIHAEAWIFPFPAAESNAAGKGLDVEQEVHYVAVFDDVVFTF